jgi:virginiamycin B lyase
MESIQMLPPRRVHQLHAGYVHDHGCAAPDPVKIARFQAEAAERARIHKAERLSKARWLWLLRRPVFASIAQTCLAALGYRGTIPAALGILPTSRGYPAALIAAYPATGEVREYPIPNLGTAAIHSAVPAPDGSVWLTEQGSNKPGPWDPREITEYQDNVRKHTVRIDPSTGYVRSTGAMTRFDPKTEKYDRISEVPSCYGIALDQQGNAWFTELLPNGKVDAKTLKVTKYTLPTANGRPGRIQVDDKGIVWFAEFDAGKIGRLDPKTGAIIEFQLPGPQLTPYALGIDRGGKVWYSSEYMGVVGRIDPDIGKVVEYPPRGEFAARLLHGRQGPDVFGSPANDKVGYFYLAEQ